MGLEGILIAALCGVVGGVIAAGLRLLHLEMEWHQVRKDLRRYYAQGRADRAREIEPRRPNGPMTAEEVYRRAKEQGLTYDAAIRRLQRE